MTGLYTRGGIEQMYGSARGERDADRSILYIDVDHMHVVNELHGFELGNELIVRIADCSGRRCCRKGAWRPASPATASRSFCPRPIRGPPRKSPGRSRPPRAAW